MSRSKKKPLDSQQIMSKYYRIEISIDSFVVIPLRLVFKHQIDQVSRRALGQGDLLHLVVDEGVLPTPPNAHLQCISIVPHVGIIVALAARATFAGLLNNSALFQCDRPASQLAGRGPILFDLSNSIFQLYLGLLVVVLLPVLFFQVGVDLGVGAGR